MADVEPFISTRRPRYENEDIRPTTKRELQGWYSYGMAVEVFTILGPGSFLPVTLEQLARERGVLVSDKVTPCISSANQETKEQCVVQLLGSEISTASFAMYTFSIAVFVQALMLVSIGSVADYGDNRKRMLLTFAFTEAFTSMLFLFVVPSIYLLGPLLAIIAITSLGCSNVMLNSFLPLLVSNHSSLNHSVEDSNGTHNASVDPSMNSSIPTKTSPVMELSNRISSRGIGYGYAAAVLMQMISIMVLYFLRKSNLSTSKSFPLRFVLFLSGLWWFIFTVPAALWLRKRPGSPISTAAHLSISHKHSTASKLLSLISLTIHAWQTLYANLRLALRLRTLRRFLLAWFLLSDAIATTGNVAILFARTDLHLSPTLIACLTITFTLSGLAGSLGLWPYLTHHYNISTTRSILLSTCLMGFTPLYGSLYYLPFIRAWGVGGIQRPWEIFLLAIIHGLALGGLNSFCRSLYGQLIPRGREVGFYAIFAVADKGSSALGPAVIGVVVDRSGLGLRGAFWVLGVLVVGGLWAVSGVSEDKGREEARALGVDGGTVGVGEGEGEDGGDGRGGSFELMLNPTPDLNGDDVNRDSRMRLLEDNN